MKVYREYDIELYSEYNYSDDNDFELINVISVEDNTLEGIFLCRNYQYKCLFKENGKEKKITGTLNVKIKAKVNLEYMTIVCYSPVDCDIISLNLTIDELNEKVIEHIKRRFDTHSRFCEDLQVHYILKDFYAK
jgi:hypothetical protein